MVRKGGRALRGGNTRAGEAQATESAIEGFAEDLGRLLGTARAKADNWLEQRQIIAKNLEQIRDTAATLLVQLGHQAQSVVGRRRGRRKAESAAGSVSTSPAAPATATRPTRRKLSAKARKAISDAQKARWARQRSEAARTK